MDLGRVPPHDEDLERSCLGAVLMGETGALEYFAELLGPQDFYATAHSRLAEVILSLRPRIVDVVTVAAELRRRGWLGEVGGLGYLEGLVMSAQLPETALQHAQTVAHLARCRRAIHRLAVIQERLYGASPEDLEELAMLAGRAVEERGAWAYADVQLLGEVALERVAEFKVRKPGEMLGTTWGFMILDHVTPGLEARGLYILGARPGMGKTGLALEIVKRNARVTGKPWLFATFEMTLASLADRQITAIGGIDGGKWRRSALAPVEWERAEAAAAKLAEIYLYGTADCATLSDVRRRLRWLREKHEVLGGVVVDYLQLIADPYGRGRNRQEQVAEISRELKLLGREFDCPVLALSQLSRNVESRQDKRPVLADLRDSGAIEQDAEAVLLLYRQDYYDAMDGRVGSETGKVEVIIAKQRNMPVCTVALAFKPQWQLYTDIEVRRDAPRSSGQGGARNGDAS